jgi:anti-sigma factor RsiW
MKCWKTRRLLSAYLDSELPVAVAGQVRDHLAGCRQCRECERGLRRATDLLADWPDIELAPDYEMLVPRLRRPETTQGWLPVPAWAAGVLAALSLAIGSLAGLSHIPRPDVRPPAQQEVASAIGLDTFAVNDVLEASIHDGLAFGQEREVTEE